MSLRKLMSAASLKPPCSASPALAACFLLLCSVSGAAVISTDEVNAWFCGGSNPGLSVSSGAAAAQTDGAALTASGESVFSPLKPEGTHRVYVVGESVAGLLGPGKKTPLSAVFESIFPDGPLELINCAPRTYGDRSITDVFEKILAYEPDLVVVLGGNEAPGHGPQVRMRITPNPSAVLPHDDEEGEAVLAEQEGTLRAMAKLARAKSVPVVFCTLPANMCGYAPSGELPFEQVWLLKGMDLLEKKDFAGALKFFELNLKGHPREPFSLFYAGRALDGLGRAKDAAAYYSDAMKYDPAPDRCPAERNKMIRRAAAEEGVCSADLEKAFSGIAADGSRWSQEYGVFVSSVIGRAVQDCVSAVGSTAGIIPVPAAPPGRDEYAAEDFRAVLSFTISALSAGAFCDAPAKERTVGMLERLYSMDPTRLESLLLSPAKLEKELQGGFQGDALKKALPAWRLELLYNAAEMYRRSGNAASARRSIDMALRLKADCPAFSFARWRIRSAAGEAAGAKKDLAKAAAGPRTRAFLTYLDAALDLAPGPLPAAAVSGTRLKKNAARDGGVSKKISDEAVELIRNNDLGGARALLIEAVAKDGDNFEARMNLCFLATKVGDVPLGEENCSEAVFLAVAPPKHAVPSKDRLPSAFYSRGLFYLKIGNKAEACRDLRRAAAEAHSDWPSAAEAREQAEKACAPGK
jgi:tetratricopeptide (TPR) repeat protein